MQIQDKVSDFTVGILKVKLLTKLIWISNKLFVGVKNLDLINKLIKSRNGVFVDQVSLFLRFVCHVAFILVDYPF